MKKRFLCMTIMMVVLLGFGAMSWAGEASVFDSTQGGILIRLFATGTGPTYSAYLEARDDDGMRLAGDQLVVTKENGTIQTYEAETAEGPLKDTFLIHDNNLTTPDVSMTFDGYYAYVFCTDNNPTHNGEVHMMKFRVALAGTPPPPTCTSFTYSNWGTCQANGTQTRTITSSLPAGCEGGTPEALTQSCTPTCTSFTYSAWGTCDNGTQTRTITGSSPTGCTGGTPAALTQTCTPPGSGLPDFAKPTVGGLASSYELGYTYNVTVTVRNEGTASAGPSTLKVYQNTTSTPGGALLFEQAVGALAPGQSTNISFVMSPRSTCSIHVYCKFIFVADANNVVVESDENDNIYVRSMLRAR